ncbi:40S ribosomal protein S29 [Intoshia linei]|uniref:Small ribosomal subunit protein uS14 n=1 Tax=Intoshia linei TaxID=1819745 RepID=A0A177B8G5_9BILA|nr:40S ribosomal protein S29 [Intoshia linei]
MGYLNIWYSHTRTYGPGSRQCRVCRNTHAIIRKYHMHICRRCFKDNSKLMGWVKYD